ncbi:MAG: hypothetical protein ACTSR2_04970 [Candidatus Hodarchaeales archaeon]
MSVTTLKAPRISGRDRVIVLPNGKVALQSKGRRRYKLSASKRKRIAASLRRFKVPVLTTAALGIGLGESISALFAGNWQKAGGVVLRNYTGYDMWSKKWVPKAMLHGLVPLLTIMLINRSGLLKPVNQKLARARIPLRLS